VDFVFEALGNKLEDIFGRLRKRGALTETDVDSALREVRIALLEADVALPVVKTLIAAVKEKAVGQEVLRSITPGQLVVKIVFDEMVAVLGGAVQDLVLEAAPPVVVLMAGLQGSGKTTTTGKLALRLRSKERKKVLVASLDVNRPAAQEQLKTLAAQAEVDNLAIVPGQKPVEIAARALKEAKTGGYDVVLLDTAGRLAIDEELMVELAAVRDLTQPAETLLVADAMTGQDAVNTAKIFAERIGITGIVLTRVDGDARGGAALSMRQVTGKPIKLLGVSEKLSGLEPFHPERVANRILGMGDVVSLVEKAAETIDRAEAEKLAARMQKGEFDLDDFLSQLRQVKKMGGMSGILGLLPGVRKVKEQLENANIDQSILKKQEAIILSMTKAERRDIRVLNASRRRRIARGSGTDVADVNRLIKQFMQMQDMMKQAKKMGAKGMMRHGLPGMGGMGKFPMLPPGGLK
jgi:signal recognition particle subunit SRP54